MLCRHGEPEGAAGVLKVLGLLVAGCQQQGMAVLGAGAIGTGTRSAHLP